MSQPGGGRIGRRVALLCLLVVSTGLSFALAEFVFRALARGAYRQAVETFHSELYEIADGEPYFYRLKADSFVQSRKMMLLK